MGRPKKNATEKVVKRTKKNEIEEIRKVLDELSKKVDKLTTDIKDINDDLNYMDKEMNSNTETKKEEKKEDTNVSIDKVNDLIQTLMFLEFSNNYRRRNYFYRIFF